MGMFLRSHLFLIIEKKLNKSWRSLKLKLEIYEVIFFSILLAIKYCNLVYTTQVNSTFRVRWLASSEVISQVLFTSEQPKKNKMAFISIFLQIKLVFGLLVIQLVWYILEQ